MASTAKIAANCHSTHAVPWLFLPEEICGLKLGQPPTSSFNQGNVATLRGHDPTGAATVRRMTILGLARDPREPQRQCPVGVLVVPNGCSTTARRCGAVVQRLLIGQPWQAMVQERRSVSPRSTLL